MASVERVPQPRQFSAVAHDSVHRRFLLFGGTYGAQRFDDTWLLGASGWNMANPGPHPAARISAAAAYDSSHSQFVLFGGRTKQAKPETCSPGEVPTHLAREFFCGDTWTFDGRSWTRKALAVSPPEREGHAMAFDAARNEVVLFGGTAGSSSTPLNDTWLWDGTKWKLANPAHRPPARLWHSMAYDPTHRKVLLFGGEGSHILNDTWLWDGNDWEAARVQATPPELRTNSGLDFDTTTGKMVLFSGSVWDARGNGLIARDSWSWDGAQWTKLPTARFSLISDFSTLTHIETQNALLANGTPSVIWMPVK